MLSISQIEENKIQMDLGRKCKSLEDEKEVKNVST